MKTTKPVFECNQCKAYVSALPKDWYEFGDFHLCPACLAAIRGSQTEAVPTCLTKSIDAIAKDSVAAWMQASGDSQWEKAVSDAIRAAIAPRRSDEEVAQAIADEYEAKLKQGGAMWALVRSIVISELRKPPTPKENT